MDTVNTGRTDAVSEYEDVIPRMTREMLRSTDPLEVIDQPDALSEAIRLEAEFARPYFEARRQAERLAALQKMLDGYVESPGSPLAGIDPQDLAWLREDLRRKCEEAEKGEVVLRRKHFEPLRRLITWRAVAEASERHDSDDPDKG